MKEKLTKISIEEISTPKDNHLTIMDRWWLTDDYESVFVRRFPNVMRPDDPFCNRDELTAHSLAESLKFDGVVFIPLAYIQN